MIDPATAKARVADYYRGPVAESYVADRADSPQWRQEQSIIEEWIASAEPHSTVLDIPLGTARFAAAYAARGLRVFGVDISDDMLRVAGGGSRGWDLNIDFAVGDAERLPVVDQGVDLVVCTRFFNWLDADSMRRVLLEFVRVGRQELIVEVHESRRLESRIELLMSVLAEAFADSRSFVRRATKRVSSTWRTRDRSRQAPQGRSVPCRYHDAEALQELFRASRLEVLEARQVARRTILSTSSVQTIMMYRLVATTPRGAQ